MSWPFDVRYQIRAGSVSTSCCIVTSSDIARTMPQVHCARMSAPVDLPPGARRVPQPQGYAFWIVGDERAVLRDAYHSFLRARWSVSLGLIALAFFVVNLAFAIVFW